MIHIHIVSCLNLGDAASKRNIYAEHGDRLFARYMKRLKSNPDGSHVFHHKAKCSACGSWKNRQDCVCVRACDDTTRHWMT